MVDFFDYLYSLFDDKYYFLRKWRIYSAFRFLIRVFSNCFLCVYFNLTNKKVANSLKLCLKTEQKYIISLTSFPARIDKVWIVIESLLRQSFRPDMIILWLSSNQFPDPNLIPKKLLELQNRGLIIRFREGDLRSHKKYYYAFEEFPDDYIITVDDDVIYNSNFLFHLVQLSKLYPMTICCNCAAEIQIKNGEVLPYIQWRNIKEQCSPSYQIMPIGVGGVLYPPNSLTSEVKSKDIFMDICPLADDIWLNIMSHLSHIKVAKTNYNSNYLPVLHKNNLTLNSKNVILGENDKQMKAVRKYVILKYSVDPYSDLLS